MYDEFTVRLAHALVDLSAALTGSPAEMTPYQAKLVHSTTICQARELLAPGGNDALRARRVEELMAPAAGSEVPSNADNPVG